MHNTEADEAPEGRRKAHMVRGLVALVVLMAGLGYTHQLGRDSLWNNEILSHDRASETTWPERYALLRVGTHPPAYSQVVLRPLVPLGLTETVQRAPSVVFALATLLVVFGFGARAFSPGVGLLAATLLAVSPLHVYYAREGRMYALLALLTTAWLWCLWQALERGRSRAWAGFAVLGAASLYTHYYSVLTLAVAALCSGILLWRAGDRRNLGRWLLAHVGIALAFLPWLPTLLFQLRNDPVSHLETPAALSLVAMPIQFFTAFVSVPTGGRLALAVSIGGLALLGCLHVVRDPGGRAEPRAYALLAAGAAGTLLLAGAISLVKPIVYIRYLVGIVPATCLLLAYGARHAGSPMRGGLLLAPLLLIGMAASVQTVGERWRPTLREPLERVAEQRTPHDVLVLVARDSTTFTLSAFRHYFDGGMPLRTRIGAPPGPADFATTLDALGDSVQGVWLLQQGDPVTPGGGTGAFSLQEEWRYPARFFEGRLVVGLSYLHRGPATAAASADGASR